MPTPVFIMAVFSVIDGLFDRCNNDVISIRADRELMDGQVFLGESVERYMWVCGYVYGWRVCFLCMDGVYVFFMCMFRRVFVCVYV